MKSASPMIVAGLALMLFGCSEHSVAPEQKPVGQLASSTATEASDRAVARTSETYAETTDADDPQSETSHVGSSPNSIDDLLLFFPSRHPQGNWNPHGLQFEDVWITLKDGTRIHAWYCPVKSPRAYILYAHGNAGNISHRAERFAHFQSIGITTLAFDYRGYGRSEGLPSKNGIIEDAEASRTHLAALAGIDESDIVLMGRSLGGAVAVQLAARARPRGLIIESSFSSLADIAHFHYPNLAWLVNRSSLNSVAVLPQYTGPLLQSHGDADRTIPFALGQALFEVANEPKHFVKIRGGDHNSPQSAEYHRTFNDFIDSL